MAAALSFRVKAGTSGAELELIASDDPAGTVSVARLAADNILLDGTVLAQHISVASLDAISATLGTFQTAASGERVVISDGLNLGYYANDQIAYRLGIVP